MSTSFGVTKYCVDVVHINGDNFLFKEKTHPRPLLQALQSDQSYAQTRFSFFAQRTINVRNSLPDYVDFNLAPSKELTYTFHSATVR